MSALETSLSDAPFSVRWDDEAAWIQIERPHAMNALRGADEAQLAEIIGELAQRARAIVLTGSGGRAFCAGADIHEVGVEDFSSCLVTLQREARLFNQILRAPCPVISAVDGYALGLGMVIAACSDVVVSTQASCFGMPELRNGVPAGMQTQVLVDHIGLARTRWLFYSGRRIDAVTAQGWGLVAEVVDNEAALSSAVRDLTSIIGSYPREGVRLQKEFFYSWISDPLESNARNNPYLAASAYVNGDPAEAVDHFLTGRSTDG